MTICHIMRLTENANYIHDSRAIGVNEYLTDKENDMGFLSKLLGYENKESEDKQLNLDKNNVYDIIYAFSILGFENNICSPSYIRIVSASNTVNIQAWISKEDCERKKISGLNTPQEIKAAVFYQEIVDFITSLNCAYDDDCYYQLHKDVEINDFIISEDLVNEVIRRAADFLNEKGNYYNDYFKAYLNTSGGMVQFGKE